jgi:soluble lytic murein transglycosylase-like protein
LIASSLAVPPRRPRAPRRRHARARRLPRFDRRAWWLAFAGFGCVLAYVVAVNALVRSFGAAGVHLLSPRHHAEKSAALGSLALHAIGELGLWPHGDLRAVVAEAAGRHGVPRELALAVARAESSFEPHVISRTGAMGLMQLMPATARELSVADPYEPAHNADGAVRYLKALLGRYAGDRARAVAAYNLGPARVPTRGALSLPAETRAYVASVLRAAGRPALPPARASVGSPGYLAASRANTLQR